MTLFFILGYSLYVDRMEYDIVNELENYQKQHYDNYIKAVKQIVNNNTMSLFDDDIFSLIKTPPLDSMDQIKSKFLSLAKKEKIILEGNKLNIMIEKYRKDVEKGLSKIRSNRFQLIVLEIDKMVKNSKDCAVVKLTKKQLNVVDTRIRKDLKKLINDSIKKNIIDCLDEVFCKDDFNNNKLVINDIMKFLNDRGLYQKKIMENIDIKILVKDTTLINGVKEQGDRYIFTINNSKIFN